MAATFVSVMADEEEETSAIRDSLVVVGDRVLEDYDLGLFVFGDDLEFDTNCVAIAEVANKVLVAFPFAVWSRHKKRRQTACECSVSRQGGGGPRGHNGRSQRAGRGLYG